MLLHGHYVRAHSEEKSHHLMGMKNGTGAAAASSLSEKTKVGLGWKEGSYCAIAPLPSPKPMMCKESSAFYSEVKPS